MTTELIELYRQLGRLVWDLYQERTTQSLLEKFPGRQRAADPAGGENPLDATLSRIDSLKSSIAHVLADIHQHPDAPEESVLLRQLRAHSVGGQARARVGWDV